MTKAATTTASIPVVAPLRWAGHEEDGWSRCAVEMKTNNRLIGVGETLGGSQTKAITEGYLVPTVLREDLSVSDEMLAEELCPCACVRSCAAACPWLAFKTTNWRHQP